MPQPIDKLPTLPPRSPESHKGNFGRVLVIGGSRGMSGAIALTGMATLRAGAGLVKLAVPNCVLDTVAGFEPSYMSVPLPHDAEGRIALSALGTLRELAEASDCVAVGPGFGRSNDLTQLVSELYRWYEGPLVLDADGLNGLSSTEHVLSGAAGLRIVTPHPGEFSRLIGGEKLDREQACQRAERLAAEHGVVVVLKGHGTLVTDGSRSYRNTTGNPGMATGGTGDCLTGILAALVCQLEQPLDAAVLGVHVHGRAGDLAAEQLGEVSLIASDLLTYLPAAFKQL